MSQPLIDLQHISRLRQDDHAPASSADLNPQIQEKNFRRRRHHQTSAQQAPGKHRIQKYALFPHMSIADNIAFGLKITANPAIYPR